MAQRDFEEFTGMHEAPAQIVRRFPDFGAFAEAYASRISLSGLFIAAVEPIDVGTGVQVDFQLNDGFRLFRGVGEVIWMRPSSLGPDLPAGMGIRFLALDEKGRELILKMLEDHVKNGGLPFELEPAPDGALSVPSGHDATPAADALEGDATLFAGRLPPLTAPDSDPMAFDPPWQEQLPEIPDEFLAPGDPEVADDLLSLDAAAADVAAVSPDSEAVTFAPIEDEVDEGAGDSAIAWLRDVEDEGVAGLDDAVARIEPLPGGSRNDESQALTVQLKDIDEALDFGLDPAEGWFEAPPGPVAPSQPAGALGAEVTALADDTASSMPPPSPAPPVLDPSSGVPEPSWDAVPEPIPSPTAAPAESEAPPDANVAPYWLDESGSYARKPRRRWPLWAGLAVLVAGAGAAGYLTRDRWWPGGEVPTTAAVTVGDAVSGTPAETSGSPQDTSVATSEVPATGPSSSKVAPDAATPSGLSEPPSSVDADGQASVTAAEATPPASPAAAERAPPAARPARAVESISWDQTDTGTLVTIAADGGIETERITWSAIRGEPPRLLLRIAGIAGPYRDARIDVGGAQIQRIRTGYHPQRGTGELHVVFDLTASSASLVGDVLATGQGIELLIAAP